MNAYASVLSAIVAPVPGSVNFFVPIAENSIIFDKTFLIVFLKIRMLQKSDINHSFALQ